MSFKISDFDWYGEKLEKSQELFIFGIPVNDMTRDELLVCLVHQHELYLADQERQRRRDARLFS